MGRSATAFKKKKLISFGFSKKKEKIKKRTFKIKGLDKC